MKGNTERGNTVDISPVRHSAHSRPSELKASVLGYFKLGYFKLKEFVSDDHTNQKKQIQRQTNIRV